ncbi:hypothetical protein FTX61_00140 [Nitriliruptoraceae bacterium ZYF776]|nr:hypothetical protein [Profundirhabdus halotolerans]
MGTRTSGTLRCGGGECGARRQDAAHPRRGAGRGGRGRGAVATRRGPAEGSVRCTSRDGPGRGTTVPRGHGPASGACAGSP